MRSRVFTREEIYTPASRLYVDESSLYPDVGTAATMIHRSGGIAFLAHLYIYVNANLKITKTYLTEWPEQIAGKYL